MLIVYEHGESVCCQKVRMTIEEKGLSYESRYVKLEAGEAKSTEFLAINPRGVVPVLIHDGRKVFESTIITEYLDDAFPVPRLMPEDPYLRSRRRYWAKQIDDEMHVPHIATISCIIAFSKPFRAQMDTQEKLDAYIREIPITSHRTTMAKALTEPVDSQSLQTSLVAYDKFLAEMELSLANSDWLAGDEFSLAEIDVVPYVWRLHNLQLGFMWDGRQRVADWLDRVAARQSFKTAVIETAIPEWIELMRSSGAEAEPTARRLLHEAGR